jgi:hypothetical protein
LLCLEETDGTITEVAGGTLGGRFALGLFLLPGGRPIRFGCNPFIANPSGAQSDFHGERLPPIHPPDPTVPLAEKLFVRVPDPRAQNLLSDEHLGVGGTMTAAVGK